MSTLSPYIKSTQPGYANSSNLLIEVMFDGDENWSKLWDSHVPNSTIKEKDLQEAESVRDRWVATGPRKYYNAKYRIGTYQYLSVGEYAWRDIHLIRSDLQTTLKRA